MQRFITAAAMAAVLIFAAPGFSQSGPAYVSDMLLLTFREGPGPSYSIIKALKSNTPLTVLEEQDNYMKVRLDTGETGWVDKKFVVYDPPKTLVIEQLEKANRDLSEKLDTLTRDHEALKGELSSQTGTHSQASSAFRSDLEKAAEQNKSLASQLKQSQHRYDELKKRSENVLDVVRKNKALKAENLQLSKEISLLKDETGHLFKTGMIKWFLSGVVVLLAGWIIGHSVSSKKRRRNSLLD